MVQTVALRLPIDVLEKLNEMGKEHCRTAAQTVAWLVKKYERESLEEFMDRERPYILHSLNQPGKETTVEELFRGKL